MSQNITHAINKSREGGYPSFLRDMDPVDVLLAAFSDGWCCALHVTDTTAKIVGWNAKTPANRIEWSLIVIQTLPFS